jgi:predicted LPLAT superfamily acyltransferase
MTNTWAHVLRFVVGFGVGGGACIAIFMTHPFELAAAIALPVFLLTSVLAERLFKRYATPDAIRRDLEDRVRNPP